MLVPSDECVLSDKEESVCECWMEDKHRCGHCNCWTMSMDVFNINWVIQLQMYKVPFQELIATASIHCSDMGEIWKFCRILEDGI